jgi:glycine betaine/proline transport system ATP-binding protein
MTDKIVLEDVFKIFGPAPEEAIRLLDEGLDKDDIFSRTKTTIGVQHASFAIQDGEIFVVMGLSGSGKSTLVRMLNRLIEPTVGAISIDGRDITKMSKHELIELRRRDMSMVFQSFALMPHQTVVQNAAFGLEVAGAPAAKRRERAMAALEAVGLAAYADSYPGELSGGMKQRVGLARALANDPSIMLMDEAFSALDPLIRTEMQDELLRLQQEHSRTVVFISHDLDEAMRIGDRIAIMQDGKVVQVGTPEEIVKRPANDYVKSFFRNVDVSHVFTAADIARMTQVTVIERPGVSVRAALETLREHDREVGIVLDRNRAYQGMVSIDSLLKEINRTGEEKYARAFLDGIAALPADTPLTEVMSTVAESRWPVPVVNDKGRYVGAISKAALLQTLDRTTK